MKKFLMLALAVVSFTLMSCKESVESKAEDFVMQYIEVLKAGDFVKLETINKATAEYTESLSEEDQKCFVKAMQQCVEEHKAEIEEASAGMLKGMLGGSMKGFMNLGSGLLKGTSKGLEKSMKGMAKAMESMGEEMDGLDEDMEDLAEEMENMDFSIDED